MQRDGRIHGMDDNMNHIWKRCNREEEREETQERLECRQRESMQRRRAAHTDQQIH